MYGCASTKHGCCEVCGNNYASLQMVLYSRQAALLSIRCLILTPEMPAHTALVLAACVYQHAQAGCIAKHHDQLYVSPCRRPSFREIVDVLRRLSPGQGGLGDPSDQPPTF